MPEDLLNDHEINDNFHFQQNVQSAFTVVEEGYYPALGNEHTQESQFAFQLKKEHIQDGKFGEGCTLDQVFGRIEDNDDEKK